MAKKSAPKTAKSTQGSLLISEVKDGLVVMRDGSLRSVVLASAINYDLMSDAEQEAVEFAYQGFLNSLHFPIQIVVRSKRMDLDSYIENLKKLYRTQDNELLRDLMGDYIANISQLIEDTNIMDKQFFIVVPYVPPIATKLAERSSLVSGLSSIFKPTPVVTISEEDFKKHKEELTQRTLLVVNGLAGMGIRSIPLSTQELIDLYYSFYNAETADNEKLVDFGRLQAPIISKEGEVPTPAPAPAAAQPQPAPAALGQPAYAPVQAPIAPAALVPGVMPAVDTVMPPAATTLPNQPGGQNGAL